MHLPEFVGVVEKDVISALDVAADSKLGDSMKLDDIIKLDEIEIIESGIKILKFKCTHLS